MGLLRRSLVGLALGFLLGGTACVLAQEGYFDADGNFVPYDAPRVYRTPPPVTGQPSYIEPPPGWSEDTVLVPPGDIPGEGTGRLLRRDELPPEFRDDTTGYVLAPDPDSYPADAYPPDTYPPDAYPAYPGDGYPPDVYPPEGVYGDVPLDRRELAPPPGFGQPALAGRSARGGWTRAVAALEDYAPAKRAAVAMEDPFARLSAIRAANTYLVSRSAAPPVAATIRAVDKVLGIPVTDDSTALPGAGGEITRPKRAKGGGLREELRRFEDYAAIKADGLDARDEIARQEISQEAARVVSQEAGPGLNEAEIAGLDAFLGLSGSAATVAQSAGVPAENP